MFDGRAAKYASFRAKFLSWAVVHIAGVDELDALRNAKNPATWYPRYHHVVDPDTGELTVSADDNERWTARAMGDTPGYEFADTPQEKRNARKLDKNARTKLAAAIRTACTKSSTARSITENADLNDGISTLMFLNKRFAQPVSNPNIALEMKQTLWNIQYGTRTIEAFLEEIEDTIASVTMHGVEVTEGDKYAAIIRGVQASDPDFADMLKSREFAKSQTCAPHGAVKCSHVPLFCLHYAWHLPQPEHCTVILLPPLQPTLGANTQL